MYNTVSAPVSPSEFKPSGPLVAPYPETLPAMPAQRRPVEALPRTLTEVTLDALKDTGATAADVAAVRRMIAAGQVYAHATEAVHDGGGDNEMTAFFDCLDTVIDRVADRRPLEPLINAALQLAAEGLAAEPGHFPWCAPGRCITMHYTDGEPYIEHHGAVALLPLPPGMPLAGDYLLSAELGADESFAVEAPYLSYTSGGNGLPLTAAELDETIDSLDAFIENLRTMRRQMHVTKAPR
ncbi:DUF6907 domain-containing protein [Streptomyces sp. NPDC059161]|uniref:DUF6907 domain-containing protein n=1 Tax=Streptomyces sp. NPDC059161 TaxID=3346749 RepID=UPI0036848D57